MAQSATDIVIWGRTTSGKTARMGRRTAAHLDYTIARLKKKYPEARLHVIQSAYNTGVAASAGTHDKDGCLDLWIEGLGWWAAQRFLRECGWAAWYRFPPAFGHHLHVISLGCPGPVGVFVPGQIDDYYRHALGLKGQHASGIDKSWFPANIKATVFDYPAYLRQQKAAAALAAAKAALAAAKAKLTAAGKKPHVDFKVFLAPGNKNQSVAQVKGDMARINKVAGGNALVVNTERETPGQRTAVATGLGRGFNTFFENECVVGLGTRWKALSQASLLLAKADPSMAKVSPKRYLNIATSTNPDLKGVTFDLMGSHLVSEANCEHVNVNGRKWREKTWRIQVNDVLEAVERSVNAGHPVVLAMDANTGVKFTGKQLFAMFQKRFGAKAVHLYNGSLDQIIAVGTNKVQFLEIGNETVANNTSDHHSVEVKVRASLR